MAFHRKPLKKPEPEPPGQQKPEELEEAIPLEEVEPLPEAEPLDEPPTQPPPSNALEKIRPGEEDGEDETEARTQEQTIEQEEDEDEEEEKDEKAEAGAAAGAAESQEAFLVVKDQEGHETVFALDRAVLTIGRDETNSICLQDKKCSRKHFIIEMAGDFYNAIDAGSTNGLRINGKKVVHRRLREGDEVTVGTFTLTYHGPTDTSVSDELLEPAQAAAPSPMEPAEDDEEEAEGAEEPGAEPAGAPEAGGDARECPKCQIEMPENAPCAQCGYKSLRLQAQEHFVDQIAKSGSLLGGLGLWKLKRTKVLEQVFALEDVAWVLDVKCPKCSQAHRASNEFRARCIACEGCGAEISLPVQDPPALT